MQPAHRRLGCAQALRALAAIARERGCGRFEWAVLDWNAPAIAFYESLGATILPVGGSFVSSARRSTRLPTESAAVSSASTPDRYSVT